MRKVSIPTVDGKYKAVFPEKCVYCGAPKEVTVRRTASAGTRRRRRYVTVEVPYCARHVREEKRNARVLTVGFVTILLTSCCVLFGVTTSIERSPSVVLMVGLGMVALGLAYGGKLLFRRIMTRSIPTMADMQRGDCLGLKIAPGYKDVAFTFTNDDIAKEFARLNGQSVSANE